MYTLIFSLVSSSFASNTALSVAGSAEIVDQIAEPAPESSEETSEEKPEEKKKENTEAKESDKESTGAQVIEVKVTKEVEQEKETSQKGDSQSSKKDKEEILFPVLNNGIEEGIAVARTAVAAEEDVNRFTSITLLELHNIEPKVLGQGYAKPCTLSSISMSNLRRRIEQAENKIAYFEIESALTDLDIADEALGCLADDVDYEAASRLYFLKGLIYHSQERTEEARAAFLEAFRFQPSLRWDPYFPKDGEALFKDARKELSYQKMIQLEILPSPKFGTLVVDGADLGNDIYLSPGEHLIQIKDVLTTKIIIEEGADKVQLLLPQLLDKQSFSVLSDQDLDATGGNASDISTEVSQLSSLLNGLYDESEYAYIADQGRVWITQVGTNEWNELEVPKKLFAPGSSPKFVASRMMVAAGSAIALTGVTMATINFQNAKDLSSINHLQDLNSMDEWEQSKNDYEEITNKYYGSVGTITMGMVVGFSGYFLGRDEQSARQ